MAANFWISSHSSMLLDWNDVLKLHPRDVMAGVTKEDVKLLKLYFTMFMQELGTMVKLRQRVVATAVTYFRRIYTKKSFSEFDPKLVAPTCLYLATKSEECSIQARVFVFYFRKLCSHEGSVLQPIEVKDILAMELRLLEALEFSLVIFHPYQPLVQLLEDSGAYKDLISFSWSMVNDSYRTDLCLTHPPYVIALGCIYLSSVMKEIDLQHWLSELDIDIKPVRSVAMEMLNYYKNYNTKPRKEALTILHKLAASQSRGEQGMFKA